MPKHCLKRFSYLLAVVLFSLLQTTTRAQLNPPLGSSPWKYTNPIPTGFTITDMSFVDNNVGLGIGISGGLIKSTDGGRNWTYIPLKALNNAGVAVLPNFNEVQLVTPSVAYAVASSGIMMKSTDAGVNWTQLTTPLTFLGKNIDALCFLNKDTGYIGGASITGGNTTSINDQPKIYITRNGGATWDSLATPFCPQQNNVTLSAFNFSEIYRISFANDSVGYVTGSNGLGQNGAAILWKIEKNVVKDYSLHRSKFGYSTTSYLPVQQAYKGLVAVNDSLAIVSSFNNNCVIRVRTGTNDSTASAVPAVYGAYEKGAYESIIWLNSTSPGYPTNLVTAGVAGQMQQMKKEPSGKIWLTSGISLLWSIDNGTSWSVTRPGAGTPYAGWAYSAIDVTPVGRIVVGSTNGLTLDSLPGSATWQTAYKNIRPSSNFYSDIDWADPCNGIAVGTSGTIAKTIDGGKTWTDITNPVLEAGFVSLSSVSYQAVNKMFYTAGTSVYKSPDQGASYNVIFTDPLNSNFGNGSNPNQFTMVGPNIAFIATYRGSQTQRTVIFRSLNADAATPVWDTVKTFPNGSLAPQPKMIRFANQDTGYVTFNRGKVYRTTDGGATWNDISPDTTVNSNGTANYTALSVINGKTLYIGGTSRKIFKSIDAGATWTDLTLPVPTAPNPVNSFTNIGLMVMNDANNGYAIAGTTLLKTTNGWQNYTWDIAPVGGNQIALYPKFSAPIDNKKLYLLPLTITGSNTAPIVEYGNAALVNLATTEAITGSSCTAPTAGSITVNATGGVAPYTYSINGGAPQSSNVFSGLTQGTKTIVIKDAGCQTVTKTITVPFTDNLTLSANNDTTVCAGAPVQMIATTNSASTTYAWTPTAGLSNAAISNPIATTNTAAAYTVTATLNGCTKTKTVNIGIKPSPVVTASPNATIVDGDVVQLHGTATNPVTIAWTPANTLTGANTLDPTAKPSATTVYTLTVKDNNNCTSTATATITVIPYCINVRNAFSPNGDGLNDKWLVTNGSPCTSDIKVAVYNRYGQEVYRSDNYRDDWDGTYKGKPVADGTYYYTVTMKLINGSNYITKGDVTILR